LVDWDRWFRSDHSIFEIYYEPFIAIQGGITMSYRITRKLTLGMYLAMIVSLVFVTLALADNVVNNVTVGGNDTFTLGGSTTVSYWIVATGGDDQAGCNASDGSAATVTINVPSGVTATPGSLTFTACGESSKQGVTFTATAADEFEITVSVSDSGPGTYHTTSAVFTLNVLAPSTPADTTPPTASPTQDPAANAYGWNKTDVTVTWNWTDNEGGSGIDTSQCTTSTISSGEGEITLYATCKDLVGNTGSASYTVKVDKTLPIVNVTGVSDDATYILGSVPTAGCETTDALSGVKTEASLSLAGGTVGSVIATCSGAEDYAGNLNSTSVTYSIQYDWNGFFKPIDNLPTLNQVKAGSAIPIKFSLNGYHGGLDIMNFKSGTIPCDNNVPVDNVDVILTAGQSSLQYDLVLDQYTYVWKTDKSWSNGTGCRQLIVTLNDGTEHLANFKFTK
jgi:hypothetical protein